MQRDIEIRKDFIQTFRIKRVGLARIWKDWENSAILLISGYRISDTDDHENRIRTEKEKNLEKTLELIKAADRPVYRTVLTEGIWTGHHTGRRYVEDMLLIRAGVKEVDMLFEDCMNWMAVYEQKAAAFKYPGDERAHIVFNNGSLKPAGIRNPGKVTEDFAELRNTDKFVHAHLYGGRGLMGARLWSAIIKNLGPESDRVIEAHIHKPMNVICYKLWKAAGHQINRESAKYLLKGELRE